MIACCVFATSIVGSRILPSIELSTIAATDQPHLWDGDANPVAVLPAFERQLPLDEWDLLNQHEEIASKTIASSTTSDGAAANEDTGVVAGRKRRSYQNGMDQTHSLTCG
jgi:hypothetical protein